MRHVALGLLSSGDRGVATATFGSSAKVLIFASELAACCGQNKYTSPGTAAPEVMQRAFPEAWTFLKSLGVKDEASRFADVVSATRTEALLVESFAAAKNAKTTIVIFWRGKRRWRTTFRG